MEGKERGVIEGKGMKERREGTEAMDGGRGGVNGGEGDVTFAYQHSTPQWQID